MKIKNRTVVLIFFSIFVILKVLTVSEEIKVNKIFNIFSIMILIVLLASNFAIKSTSINLNRNQKKFILFICLWLLWAVLSSVISELGNAVSSYLPQALLFYITFILFLRYSIYKDLSENIIVLSSFIIGTFLMISYITHFNGLDVFNNMKYLFSSVRSERYRISYGLNHPNVAGNLCVLYIVLNYLRWQIAKWRIGKKNIRKKIKEVYYTIAFFVSVIMLLSTASRSSITGVIVFSLSLFLIRTYIKGNRIWKVFFVMMVISVVFMALWSIDFNRALIESNRLINYTVNIPIIIKQHKLLIGFGLVSSGYFGNVGTLVSSLGSSYVDSMYLYILMSTGIIGCVLFFFPFIYCLCFYVKKVKGTNYSNRMIPIVLAMIITNLYVSLFETSLLYLSYISSFIYWIIIVSNRFDESYE